ncbi:MAG: deoxyribonuclease IV [Verrucomicrobiia bacterium]
MPKIVGYTKIISSLGAHVSIAGGFDLSIDRALSVGCGVMQIFVKSNRQWFAPPLRQEMCRPFLEHPRRKELQCVFAHSGYLINPAAPEGDVRKKSIHALVEELQRADQLQLPFLVLHPGAHLGVGVEAGIRRVVKALNEVIEKTSHLKTCIALETTAGQGTSIGHELEHLASILGKVKKPKRFCVCVDTAHLFAAGYEIHIEKGYEKTVSRLDELIGLRQIAAFHLNDSKTALGSRVDRHEHIGKGKIGLSTFRWLLNDKRFFAVPKVLETPKSEDMHEDRENLQRLYQLLK